MGLTAMAGAVLLLYENEMSDARDSASRGSLVVNTDAGQIEYAEAGSGFPLLSIHGAGGGFDQGLANAAELVGEGFRIVSPSLSPLGMSGTILQIEPAAKIALSTGAP